MKAEVIHPKDLDSGLRETWRRIRRENAFLHSPFFSVEFTEAIGAVRADARVAVFRQDGDVVGFLPHHVVRPGVGKPIGGQINDYQGPIAAADAFADHKSLLRAAGLTAYDFNHAPRAMTVLAGGAYETAESPIMDLSEGFDAYFKSLDKAGRHTVKETERRIRKMTREIGPVRFDRNDRSTEAWDGLLRMKNASFGRKGAKSVLDLPWVAGALEQLRALDTPEFAGLLSTVHAGDRLVAAHFGMRSEGVWNWWFNTYDYEIRNLAPGLITILEAAKTVEQEGVRIIDFGRGVQYYKRAFSSGVVPLCEGSIERGMLPTGLMRQTRRFALRKTNALTSEKWRVLAKRASRKLVGAGMHLPV